MRKLIAVLFVCGCSSTTDMTAGDVETGGSSQGLTSVEETGGDGSTGGSAPATGGAAATGGKTGGARATGGSTGGSTAAATGGRITTGSSAPMDCEYPASANITPGACGDHKCRCSDFADASNYCSNGACVDCPYQAGLGVVYQDCDNDPSNGCEMWTAGQACP